MAKKNDGGYAFPSDNAFYAAELGMTLRDYFAAKAVAGLLSMAGSLGIAQAPDSALARQAYSLADAMIAARGDA